MSACEAKVFDNVSKAAWTACKAEVAKHDFDIEGDHGAGHAHGIDATWDYEPNSRTLTVQVTKIKSFLNIINCDNANAEIDKVVNACKAANP